MRCCGGATAGRPRGRCGLRERRSARAGNWPVPWTFGSTRGWWKARCWTLLDGSFVDRKENVLVFGNPGSGKTHLLCAIGQELVRAGRTVYFTSTVLLVQELLLAKRELRLPKAIKKLARYQALVLVSVRADPVQPLGLTCLCNEKGAISRSRVAPFRGHVEPLTGGSVSGERTASNSALSAKAS
ncbi:MAG: ATP-binding protein [Planctomycetota bacterium]|nr:ATP-binding protein [Planctomycetota bacterium]